MSEMTEGIRIAGRDAWVGFSADVIARFIDVMEVEYELSRAVRHGYRRELEALDDWMRQRCGRTLAAARRGDLRVYLRTQLAARERTREFERLLMCLQHFYRHLKESGFRDDNAASRLCSILGSTTFTASSGHGVLRRAG